MRIHILGICGTFMGGLAQILKESGHVISGSDIQFYPPMSVHLDDIGIEMIKGYSEETLPKADLYVIGNALSRGNECVEYILNNNLPFKSGPEMLGNILKDRKVIAISGTHGKTTTSYMLVHIFANYGRDIGFLVGGVSSNFKTSASLGTDEVFVIEADEYDSAFFDKRSKFIHYSPHTVVINNIEFDHADIFNDISDIKRQFHHLLKIIPSNGNVIYFKNDRNTQDVIEMGSWSHLIKIDDETDINYELKEFSDSSKKYCLKDMPLIGDHNFKNYVSAILAAKTESINVQESLTLLKSFDGVKRRLEFKGIYSNIKLYDDFAHHPTAISFASESIKDQYKSEKVLGLVELGSNTMSDGYHGAKLLDSVKSLDDVIWLDHKEVLNESSKIQVEKNVNDLIDAVKKIIFDYDIILLMTNKDSHKIIQPLINYLEKK